ncbi:MAG: sulfite exporter TauE/SafE family protein [Blastocatellia bacterium]|nr:sulfite exporter TauE/SafE family protein [Blastocatellia bacterium]MCX7752841.1 sulfite exporter TauE/SafE family protein [Blastocatellia bacterium]MDW8257256.1 sulfite exporter TauE/SafE family protein [Acidobacteriota bacterium]
MPVELWTLAFLAGLVAQFVDVMTGMGFGAIASSFMLAAGLPPLLVVATVNLVKVGNGLMAGLAHWGFGNVRRDWVIPLSISGVVGALAGAVLITRLSEEIIRLWVSVALLLLGGSLLFRFFFTREEPLVQGIFSRRDLGSSAKTPDDPARGANAGNTLLLVGIGFVAGFFNAVSGAYGPVVTTLLMLTRGGHPRYAVGTVSLAELFVAGASTIGLLRALGTSNFPLWLPIAVMAGGIVAAPCGAYLCRHLPGRTLEGLIGLTVMSLNLWNVLRAFG